MTERTLDINFWSLPMHIWMLIPTCEHMYAYTTQTHIHSVAHSLFILVDLKAKQPVDGKST